MGQRTRRGLKAVPSPAPGVAILDAARLRPLAALIADAVKADRVSNVGGADPPDPRATTAIQQPTAVVPRRLMHGQP